MQLDSLETQHIRANDRGHSHGSAFGRGRPPTFLHRFLHCSGAKRPTIGNIVLPTMTTIPISISTRSLEGFALISATKLNVARSIYSCAFKLDSSNYLGEGSKLLMLVGFVVFPARS